MESRHLQLTNINLHYLIGGKGPVLILLPSLWITSKSYSALGKMLSDHYTVIIPDIYKYPSVYNHKTSKLIDYTETLSELIDKLKLQKPNIVGISFSGLIATTFTNEHSEQIDRLFLFSTSACDLEIIHKKTLLISGYIKLLLGNLLSLEGLKTNLLWFTDAFSYFISSPKQFINEVIIGIKNYHTIYNEMKIPTTLFLTTKDEFFPLNLCKTKNANIKNLKIIEIDGNHTWFFTNPEKFVETLVNK